MLSYADNVKYVLESGIQVLAQQGDKDFVCNWEGGYNWVQNLDWHHKDAFVKQELKEQLNQDNELQAWGKSEGGLTFLKVKDAGHMVPMDQPKNALFILDNLLQTYHRLDNQQENINYNKTN